MSTNCMCRVVYFFKSHCYKSPLCLSPPLVHYTGARIQWLYMYCFAGEIFIFAKKIYSESGKPWKGQRSVEVREESRRAVISSPFVSEWRWKMGRQLLRHQRNCFSQSFSFFCHVYLSLKLKHGESLKPSLVEHNFSSATQKPIGCVQIQQQLKHKGQDV